MEDGDISFSSPEPKAEFSCLLVSEKSKMSQPIRGWGGHLGFPIGPKNTNFVQDVEILHPVKFHGIPFSGFREDRLG